MFTRIEEEAEYAKRGDTGTTKTGFKPCLDQVATNGLRKFT